MDRPNLQLARLYRPGSIVGSLKAGIDTVGDVDVIRVVLGDTLITDPYDGSVDFVYTGAVKYSGRWCLVESDSSGYLVRYIDKQFDADTCASAIAGYYHFTNMQLLRQCTESALAAGEKELSFVLSRYGLRQRIVARSVNEWFDFGHLDKLADARRRLISSRSFNTLQVDPILHTVTKTSTNNDRLTDELNWYLQLPDSLQVLAPRIVNHEITDRQVCFTQEFYGYTSLAELFVFGDFSVSTWDSILQRVLEVHQLLSRYEGTVTSADTFDMYFNKTRQRLELLAQSVDWKRLGLIYLVALVAKPRLVLL